METKTAIGGSSLGAHIVVNLIAGMTLVNIPMPVMQPSLGFSRLAKSSTSGSNSKEQQKKFKSLPKIYENSSEVELAYDSDGEALLV